METHDSHLTATLAVKIYDELHDQPADPFPYGIFRWLENDAALFLYDRFDIWQLDPLAKKQPVCITNQKGRKTNIVYRYIPTNKEERFLTEGQQLLLRIRNDKTKYSGWATFKANSPIERHARNIAVSNNSCTVITILPEP